MPAGHKSVMSNGGRLRTPLYTPHVVQARMHRFRCGNKQLVFVLHHNMSRQHCVTDLLLPSKQWAIVQELVILCTMCSATIPSHAGVCNVGSFLLFLCCLGSAVAFRSISA